MFRFEDIESGRVTFVRGPEQDDGVVQFTANDGTLFNIGRSFASFQVTAFAPKAAKVFESKDNGPDLEDVAQQLEAAFKSQSPDPTLIGTLLLRQRDLKRAQAEDQLVEVPAVRLGFKEGQADVLAGFYVTCLEQSRARNIPVVVRKGDPNIGAYARRFVLLDSELLTRAQHESLAKFANAGWKKLAAEPVPLAYTSYCIIFKCALGPVVILIHLRREPSTSFDVQRVTFDGDAARSEQVGKSYCSSRVHMTPAEALFFHFGPLTLDDLRQGRLPNSYDMPPMRASEMFWIEPKV